MASTKKIAERCALALERIATAVEALVEGAEPAPLDTQKVVLDLARLHDQAARRGAELDPEAPKVVRPGDLVASRLAAMTGGTDAEVEHARQMARDAMEAARGADHE